MKDDVVLLSRIIKYCTEIKDDQKRFGNSFDNFLEDLSYQRSCSMSLMQIGETVNKLSHEFRERHDEIDWVSVIGFRNLVAHKYESLNCAMVWEIIIENVPKLKQICEKILIEKDVP